MTQPEPHSQLRQWTVHDDTGAFLGAFPHSVFADIFASTLADITQKDFVIRDSESPAQRIVRLLEETKIQTGEDDLG